MSDAEDIAAFAAGVKAAHAAGPIHLELDADMVVALIAAIQLACRHPGTRGSVTRKSVEGFARDLQAELARRSPDVGRLLERGCIPFSTYKKLILTTPN